MNKYNNGKIYSIRSHQIDKIYIGSTIEPLYKRLNAHKRKYKEYKNGGYHYVSSFELIQYNDVYIELIENIVCNSKEELRSKEGNYIRLHKNKCVNKKIECQTMKQYTTQYKIDNPDKIKERNNDKRIKNKIKEKCMKCNKEITKVNMKRHIKNIHTN